MKLYMNTETGSVDTRDGWIYEDEIGKHDPVEDGTVFEVVWDEKEPRYVEAGTEES